ncbi:MAG: hypothetical protein F8N39_05495 [Clostridiaceae bacterium]|nr:hypothetical protein [Clostridiaceae bacterium]
MQAILERRSIRKYEEKEVSDELVKELLRAAMAAPSSNNTQPLYPLAILQKKKNQPIDIMKQKYTFIHGDSICRK